MMETNKKNPNSAQSESVEKALQEGRNANDNFRDSDKDDYGSNDAEEIKERHAIKGGTGQHGIDRNRNDDFKDKE